MKLTLKKREQITHDVESFLWQPDQPVDFIPGQFLRWTVQHNNPDDRGIRRFFSISSSPTEELLRLTTKFAGDKSSSFKKALFALKVGAEIEASPPSGTFVLDGFEDGEVMLVAGGIGITPFRSMLKFLHDAKSFAPIHLVYGMRSPQDAAFHDLLVELEETHPELHVTYVLESGKDEFKDPRAFSIQEGRISAQLLQSLDDKGDRNASKLMYLSGPEPMIVALKEQLLAADHPEEMIKTDYFPGYLDQ